MGVGGLEELLLLLLELEMGGLQARVLDAKTRRVRGGRVEVGSG